MQINSNIGRLQAGRRREDSSAVDVQITSQQPSCQGVSLCGCNSGKKSIVDSIIPSPFLSGDASFQEFRSVPTEFSFDEVAITDRIIPQYQMMSTDSGIAQTTTSPVMWKNDLVSVETDTVLSCPTGKCGQISKPVMDQKKKVSVLPNLILLGAILGTAYFVARRR